MDNFLENQRQAMEQVAQDESLVVKEPFQKTKMWSKKQQKEIDGLLYSLNHQRIEIKDKDYQLFEMIIETKQIGETKLKETQLKVNGKTRERRVTSKSLNFVQMTQFEKDWNANWGSSCCSCILLWMICDEAWKISYLTTLYC